MFKFNRAKLAQAWSPGVKPGDYFTYSVSTYWNSSNSSRTVPVYLLENNNTKWYNVSVSRVSGNNVTATNSWSIIMEPGQFTC